jgi:anthranilate 1,2-dioxygenase small subunit
MSASPSLRSELRDLYDDYALVLDDMELEHWVEFFTDDAVYKVISSENHAEGLELATLSCTGRPMLMDRVAAARMTTVYEPRTIRHSVGCVRVNNVAEGRIEAQANFVLFESLLDREPHILMVGRYLDVVVREGAALKFRQRLCVYDNYRIRTSLIIPV